MLIGIGILLLIFLALVTFANYHLLNGPEYAHRDFMSLWGGGWAVLHGIDPYDPELWQPLRTELGSLWISFDRGNPFPLWTLVLMTPLTLLPLGWGAAIWLTIGQVLLALSFTLLLTEMNNRRPTLTDFALTMFGVFLFRATLVTLHNGQITILLVAVLSLFLVLFKRNHHFLSGVILGFIILKPNLFILFAPLITLWLIHRRLWKVITGGAVTLVILFTATWLIQHHGLLPGRQFERKQPRQLVHL